MPSIISPEEEIVLSDIDEESDEMSLRKSTRNNKKSSAPSVSDKAVVRTAEKRIFIAENQFLNEQNPEIVALRHPSTKNSSSFLFNEDNSEIREIVTYKEEHRSWFIGDCIESNGKIYLACPVDPCLIVMPYLRASERNVPLDQLLKDQDFPEIHRLASNSALMKKLDKIADAKGSKDLNVWKFNEEKAMQFLAAKVNRLSKALKDKQVDVRGGAVSGNYVKSLNQDEDEMQFLRFAHGILSEFLEGEMSQKLEKFMKIPAEEKAKPKKREPTEKIQSSNKKAKSSAGPEEDYSKGVVKVVKKEVVLTAKQKALAKNATGTKGIMSFFAKK